MQQLLIEKLGGYISVNNPDLLISLQQSYSLRTYLEDKIDSISALLGKLISEGRPQYVIEELCMNSLTEELRPSRFNYVKQVLEEEFAASYELFRRTGVLTYELLNMLDTCQPLFDKYQFSEANEENRLLRYEVTGIIAAYLDGN